jgi:dihydrofolate synthase/folylpolyglutamate synthase
MNYEESVGSLLALGRELAAPHQARVQKFGLENVALLAEALDNPHRAVPCAHVAGTNGKGSTAAMLESILRAAGLRTGLYTSPHLERINERIRVNGDPIADEEFAGAWTRVHAVIEALMASGKLAAHPTFFECVTAMAFLVFADQRAERRADQKLDFAVYEVGLGGRLDSTNIVTPEVAVITPIDFDHENFLGHSIEEIAEEKAGIIKAAAPVVSSVVRPEARQAIARKCSAVGTTLIEIDKEWTLEEAPPVDGYYRATATQIYGQSKLKLAPALPGRFQLRNALAAATAARVIDEKGFPVADDAIERGIAAVKWPGRLERLSAKTLVYLDGAHNPSGARELLRFWQENFAGRRIVLVYGAMRDKAIDEIAGVLFPHAHAIILTEPRQPRAISAKLLREMTAHLAPKITVIRDPAEALEGAIGMAGIDGVIFATGSLYLVGDIRTAWRNRKLVAGRPNC